MSSVRPAVRTVCWGRQFLSYEFRRKNVKRINLRIRTDGSVAVSAPGGVAVAVVDEFVASKGEWILRTQTRMAQKRRTIQPRQYVTGETLRYLGEPLTLRVREGRPSGGEIVEGELLLTVPPGSDTAGRERAFLRFWDERCHSIFSAVLGRQYPLFRSMGVAEPVLRVRGMRSRWGSCHYQKGSITLSRQLLECPRAAVEYVVLHEYCHFLHPNHGKEFYALVSQLMPDWRQRKALLHDAGE